MPHFDPRSTIPSRLATRHRLQANSQNMAQHHRIIYREAAPLGQTANRAYILVVIFHCLVIALFGLKASGTARTSIASTPLLQDISAEEEQIVKWAAATAYAGGSDTVRIVRNKPRSPLINEGLDCCNDQRILPRDGPLPRCAKESSG